MATVLFEAPMAPGTMVCCNLFAECAGAVTIALLLAAALAQQKFKAGRGNNVPFRRGRSRAGTSAARRPPAPAVPPPARALLLFTASNAAQRPRLKVLYDYRDRASPASPKTVPPPPRHLGPPSSSTRSRFARTSPASPLSAVPRPPLLSATFPICSRAHLYRIGRELTKSFRWAHYERAPASKEEHV